MCIKINFKRFFKRIFPCLREKPEPIPDIPEPLPEPLPPIPEEPEPPYFGASVYELIQQNVKDIENFLGDLRLAGGNATEIFFIHSLNQNVFQPYIWDGKGFYLDSWNELFWDNFRRFLRTCKEFGIAVFIRILDRVSIKRAECNKFYCFMNNVQGFTDVYNERLYSFYSRLNKRILKELENVGIKKFFIIPMNECDGDIKDVVDFHIAYITDLKLKGIPKSQIIFSADPYHFDELKELGCRIEVHNVASFEDLQVLPFGNFIFPNGDGCHGEGIKSWNSYGEPSVAQAKELGEYIRANDLFGYCYKDRGSHAERGKIDMSKVDFQALKALVKKII